MDVHTTSDRSRRLALNPAILLSLSLLLGGIAHGEDGLADYYWNHPESIVIDAESMAFTADRIGGTKNESVHLWVYDEGSMLCALSLFHVDTFLFDRWGMYALVVPESGDSIWYTRTFRPDEVSFAPDRLAVGSSTINIAFDASDGRMTGTLEGITIDLAFSGRLPPWEPGTGRVDYTPDGELFQRRILVSPWARASGSVSVAGERYVIDGDGYVSKTRFSNPLARFAPYIHAMRLYDENDFVALLDVTLHEAYDGRRLPMLIYAHDGEWVMTTREYSLAVVETRRIEGVDYDYPTAVEIESEQEGIKFSGVFREERFVRLTDVFQEIPGFVREILDLVLSRPVYFRSLGSFEGSIEFPDGTIRTLSLTGPYEYTVVH